MREMPVPDTSENQSYSRLNPALQTAINSSSLGEFKTCERKYYYSILWAYEGRGGNVHTAFGQFLHDAVATYHTARIAGAEHEEALRGTVQWALRKTWNKELQRPWISNDPSKNRMTLLRAIVWYFDQFKEDSLETFQLANGKAAVEVSFAIDSQLKTVTTDETIIMCGRFDRIVKFNDRPYGQDTKTTGYSLDPNFFAQFTPENQLSFYNAAGKMVFQEPLEGFLIDGIQVGANFIRVQRGIVPRPPGILEEWLEEFEMWVREMERAATQRYWKMNDKACSMYGGCKFRAVCARSPAARETWLKADYVRRHYDPMQRNEEI